MVEGIELYLIMFALLARSKGKKSAHSLIKALTTYQGNNNKSLIRTIITNH